MAGYSGTPLAQKLGFKEGFRAGLVNPPKDFRKELGDLPAQVEIFVGNLRRPLDLIVLFTDSKRNLKREFSRLAQKLANNGMLWISWPKRSSGVATDLSENIIREIG